MECLMFPHDQAQEIYSWQEFHRSNATLFSVHHTEIHNTEYKRFCCSVAKSCWTLCNHMDCSTPGFPVLHYLPEFAQTHVHWVGGAIQPSNPLLPSPPPAFSLSQHQGLFQWISSSHQVAKVLELKLQHQSFQQISRLNRPVGLTDFLAIWGTLKSLLQYYNSKSSILQCSAFFMVQLSHLHTTTGKTIALTIWTFVGKMMSLFLITLFYFNYTVQYSKCINCTVQ